MCNLFLTWKLTLANIKKAQKKAYDLKTRVVDKHIGDRVIVLMPFPRNWKFARPFYGPIGYWR